MRKRLSELEQLVMEEVWRHPGSTVAQCQEALAGAGRPLKENTIRTLLTRLEVKSYVRHKLEGRAFLYHPSEPRKNIAAQAVKQVIDKFCNGSLEELLTGMVENDVVSPAERARSLEAELS